MTQALIELRGVEREFAAGDATITVLKDINLRIDRGEMVAIVGASGSGKSTLMNILGCLDRPTRGSYRMQGRETGSLNPDELAALRREHFGFVFQRYQLLPGLTAWQNVEIPAIYAGMSRDMRRARAHSLLEDLELGDRVNHRPAQLSGGQQQRVSIARALMNGGGIILADEPTGALDTHSGQTVLRMLRQLNAAGHTVIMVTHDADVAALANRIVEIRDGHIVADRRCSGDAGSTQTSPIQASHTQTSHTETRPIQADSTQADSTQADSTQADSAQANSTQADPTQANSTRAYLTQSADKETVSEPCLETRRMARSWIGPYQSAFGMALLALRAHRLRAFLTMLGISIGIAAVVAVVALGQGSRKLIIEQVKVLGSNTIEVIAGKDFGDEQAASIKSLVPRDVDVLARQHFVHSVSPQVYASQMARYRNMVANVDVVGVGDQHIAVRNWTLSQGRFFDRDATARLAQEAVIDPNLSRVLFRDHASPIGRIILVGNMPARVIGVLNKPESLLFSTPTPRVYLPYTTAMHRLFGQSHVSTITIRLHDGVPVQAAERAVENIMMRRHGIKDFFTFNNDSFQKTLEGVADTLSLVMSLIAAISLLVGGAGVMNIMLVSVHERTSEIGVRMAIGARRDDVMRQFLLEAVVVCLAGGVLGLALAIALKPVAPWISGGLFELIYSPWSMVIAFAASLTIGVVAGYLPARKAARLDPVQALARE